MSCKVDDRDQGPGLSPQPEADQHDPPPTLQSDMPSPTEERKDADPSDLPTWAQAIATTAQDAPGSEALAREVADKARTSLESLPEEVGNNAGPGVNKTVTLEPGSHSSCHTGAELEHSSVWAEFQRLSRSTKMEVSAIVQEWKDRLAQHCCICNNWALDKSSVKCHLIRMHAQEWYRVAEQVAAACKAHKHLFARNEECSLCHKQVYGVERHALQCPVLFQACFMSCLFSTPAVVPNIWQRLKCLTREASIAHLEGMQPVAQEVSEPLTLFCVLCARKDMEAPIVDIQAWRRHLQQVHGVAKAVLNEQFHEHAALVHISRPCPFCRLPFQKSPKLHRAKCLPLAQLLSVKHGYAGISGEPDRGSVGACFTNDGNAQLHPTGSQGQHRDGEACQISETGEGRGQRPAVRAKAPRASRRRGDRGPGPGLENRAENHPRSAGEARSGAQSSGGRPHLRAFLLDHGDVDFGHAAHGDESLAGAVRTGQVHDHTPGDVAHESVDGNGGQADQIREGCGSHEGDDGSGPFSRCPASLDLRGMEPTGEKNSGHGPTASIIRRAEGRDQNSESGGNDGGSHTQVFTHAEVGREHFSSDCGVHLGADHETQGGENPHRDGQNGELGSAVADRSSPSPGENRVNGHFSQERSIASPSRASICVPDSCLETPNHSAGGNENSVTSRLRLPHGRAAISRLGDYRGAASYQL